MLLQTNSYIVPKEKREEHARLLRRFRQTLAKLGADHFEVYEQVASNWGGESGGRYVQIMRFRDRRHQLAVQSAERVDPTAQALIQEFCELINFPFQQQQGLFAVGFYTSVLPIAPMRAQAEAEGAEAEPEEQPEAGPEGRLDPNAAGEPAAEQHEEQISDAASMGEAPSALGDGFRLVGDADGDEGADLAEEDSGEVRPPAVAPEAIVPDLHEGMRLHRSAPPSVPPSAIEFDAVADPESSLEAGSLSPHAGEGEAELADVLDDATASPMSSGLLDQHPAAAAHEPLAAGHLDDDAALDALGQPDEPLDASALHEGADEDATELNESADPDSAPMDDDAALAALSEHDATGARGDNGGGQNGSGEKQAHDKPRDERLSIEEDASSDLKHGNGHIAGVHGSAAHDAVSRERGGTPPKHFIEEIEGMQHDS